MGVEADADVDGISALRHVEDDRARLPIERARQPAGSSAETGPVARRVRGLDTQPEIAATVDVLALHERVHLHSLAAKIVDAKLLREGAVAVRIADPWLEARAAGAS